MKLTEALQTLNEAELLEGKPFQVMLACGFTPLHLETFFGAHLQKLMPARRVRLSGGLYGDLAGTLERQLPASTHAAAIALEWPDLDPRLGYRRLGGWGPAEEIQIVETVRASLLRLRDAIVQLASSVRIAVSLPTLPLPPAFHAPGWEAGQAELEISAALMNFAAGLASTPAISVVNPQRLLTESAYGDRLDLKADLLTGQPYSIPHADALGAAMARLLQRPSPKKGLITDLDDTLWRGLVGEIGAEAVAWDLDSHAQVHGLYQQTLAALAGQGVLLAVASKNNPETVDEAFARPDLLIGKEKIFPMEVHWFPKSESIGRILAAWNIGADSVVFVDDSPMELAEVKAAWPEIECFEFKKNDHAAAAGLFRHLRDLFGRSRLSDEDAIRLASIRAASAVPSEEAYGPRQEAFLSQADGVLTVQFNPPASDSRVLDLVNKTNQFNLNGVRHNESDWRRTCDSLNGFVLVVSYKDKYGPLGKIAVLAGHREDSALRIRTWVMSCRAFSRRIEHGCMDLLFSKFDVGELRLDFLPTAKNSPFREFSMPLLGAAPDGPFTVTREQFSERRPAVYYKMETVS